MSKTIFNLKEVFTRFLEDTEKQSFMIPAYQRGYKWASDNEFSQVQVLMRDLYSAFNKGNGGRYYLQFITVKPAGDDLEVIDGQQRLTTLTIFFCIWSHYHDFASEFFVKDKLKYETRINFVDKFIFNDIQKVLDSDNWDTFFVNNSSFLEDIDNQDVYHIFHAVKYMQRFLLDLRQDDLKGFYNYLCTNVFLIMNLLESDLASEKIFINVNKGVKLRDEDLVKGLIITRIPLDHAQVNRFSENEINEIRSNIGRQWDDLVHWTSRDDVSLFFNGEKSTGYKGLNWLIDLAFPDLQSKKDMYPVFSYLDNLCRANSITATEIFNRIRQTMLKLNDLLCDAELKNLLGYVIHSYRGAKIDKIWKDIGEYKTKAAILKSLKKHCLKLLPWDYKDSKLLELNYLDDKEILFDLFLILDICKFLPINGRSIREYEFSKIILDRWSLEHIFPQSSKDFKSATSLEPGDLLILKELLPETADELTVEEGDAVEKVNRLLTKIHDETSSCTIEADEREILARIMTRNASILHRVGNLALLQPGINSSLSNNYFEEKRKIIVKHVSAGNFVPFHTYDLFSKLIIGNHTGLHTWSKSDIEEHENYINAQLKSLIKYLNPEQQA